MIVVVAIAAGVLAMVACADSNAAREAEQGRRLAATCAACHGTDGRSVTASVAALARMPKELIAARMREFRDGSRPATVMRQLAKGYTDAQIEAVAAHLSSVPEAPERRR